jgi:hypothetical protein
MYGESHSFKKITVLDIHATSAMNIRKMNEMIGKKLNGLKNKRSVSISQLSFE